MASPRPNGRRQLPTNVVYSAIQAAGGPMATQDAIGVSLATLNRWRREGSVPDAKAVLRWAATVHPTAPDKQLRLARRLAGLAPTHRVRPGGRMSSATYPASSLDPGRPDAPAPAVGAVP